MKRYPKLSMKKAIYLPSHSKFCFKNVDDEWCDNDNNDYDQDDADFCCLYNDHNSTMFVKYMYSATHEYQRSHFHDGNVC